LFNVQPLLQNPVVGLNTKSKEETLKPTFVQNCKLLLYTLYASPTLKDDEVEDFEEATEDEDPMSTTSTLAKAY